MTSMTSMTGRKAPRATGVKKTLDRALSRAGHASRTEAARLIRAGRVRVNGRVERDAARWVDPARDRIEVDRERLEAARRITLALYKPRGYVTTRSDPQGRKTVYDLLEGVEDWVHPVGRLDRDTSGLLLLTNDSRLAERLTNPDHHVPKTYLVKASRFLEAEELARLASGVDLDDGPTRPATARRVREAGGRTVFELTLTEGRNRQVRRMVESLGAKVLKLVRVSIGPLRLGDLAIGRHRELTAREASALLRAGRGPRKDAGPHRAQAP